MTFLCLFTNIIIEHTTTSRTLQRGGCCVCVFVLMQALAAKAKIAPPCSLSSHLSHVLHTQGHYCTISWVFERVVSLSWSIKLFSLVGMSTSFHHFKSIHTHPHTDTHTHTHIVTSERKYYVASLLRNTQLRGRRLLSGLSRGRGAGEKEGGLWHQKKLGSLVTVTWDGRTVVATHTLAKNSSRPLPCTPPCTHEHKQANKSTQPHNTHQASRFSLASDGRWRTRKPLKQICHLPSSTIYQLDEWYCWYLLLHV